MRYIVHNYFPGYRRRAADEGAWQENKHPRIQGGENAGQFAPKGGGGGANAHGLNPYFAAKYGPSTSSEHFASQVKSAVQLKNASSYYRNVIKMLLNDADKFGATPALKEQLKGKIAESLEIQKQNLLKKGDAKKAGAIEAKLVKWGVAKPTPAPASTSPTAAPPPLPIAPALSATAEELSKAKGTGSMSMAGVPEVATSVVKAFNDKYAGKALTDPAQLARKVQEFKQVHSFIQQAKVVEEQTQVEQLKGLTKEFHINEEQSAAFAGLAKMVIGSYSTKDLIAKFHEYESEAKHYGYPISGFECALVKSYSNGTYQQVNSALRKGSWTEQEHAYSRVLNSALKKMPAYTGTVWRGASLDVATQEKYKVGNIVEERAFTSTSTNSGHSQTEKGNTRYVIQAKGRRAANIKKLSNHQAEDEVLFQARTFFKVTKVQGYPGGPMTVHMEEYWND